MIFKEIIEMKGIERNVDINEIPKNIKNFFDKKQLTDFIVNIERYSKPQIPSIAISINITNSKIYFTAGDLDNLKKLGFLSFSIDAKRKIKDLTLIFN